MALPDPAWNDQGLVAAVIQDADTGVVLMMAWMSPEAFDLTRSTGELYLFSRSRNSLWRKGATSGNLMSVVEVRLDCDRDTVLVRARPTGPACHTGRTACFFYNDGDDDDGAPTPHVVDRLDRVVQARRDAPAGGKRSYTRTLLDAGIEAINDKIAEEHGELAAELLVGDRAKVVHEAADLWFHVMVGLSARGIAVEEVWRELGRRFGVSGLDEKAARTGHGGGVGGAEPGAGDPE